MVTTSVALPLAITTIRASHLCVASQHLNLLHRHWSVLRSIQTLKSPRLVRRPARIHATEEQHEHASHATPEKQQRSDPGRWLWLGIGVTFAFMIVLCVKRLSSLEAFKAPASETPSAFTANVFGSKISLAERTPGWIYFMLLMAAGCGLFISEEALSVWVGATLARTLSWNSTQSVFMASLSQNMPHILSTVLWVYWGVCISDLIPFYAGKLAAKSRSGTNFCEKLGISKEKLDKLSQTVQRYGNLIGFVERFSIGARNPTAFLAGASGIAPSNFFAGVCLGGLLTLPIQMSVGVALRENPAAALAAVAAFVGIWTVFPYLVAAALSLFYFTTNKNQQ